MVSYNLTEAHKRILRQLVRGREDGKLPRTFYVSDVLTGGIIHEWEGKDPPELELMDLQVLAEDDYLSLRVTGYTKGGRVSTVECTLRQKAIEAVSTDFAPPKSAFPSQVNIGAIINTMSGGSLQAVGIAEDAEISQVVNDPDLLRSQVDALTENLLNEVKLALTGTGLTEYTQAAQGLREELLTDKPDSSAVKRFTSALAFLANIEGTVGLMVRAWPYLYPLLLIAAQRLP